MQEDTKKIYHIWNYVYSMELAIDFMTEIISPEIKGPLRFFFQAGKCQRKDTALGNVMTGNAFHVIINKMTQFASTKSIGSTEVDNK